MLHRVLIVTLLITVGSSGPAWAQEPIASPARLARAVSMAEAPASARQAATTRRDSRWNGFLIGFVVGAIPGIYLGTLIDRYCDNEGVNCAVALPLYGGVFGLAGGGIGFAIDGAIGNSRAQGPARPQPNVRFSVRF